MDNDTNTAITQLRAFAYLRLIGNLAVVYQKYQQRNQFGQDRNMMQIQPPRNTVEKYGVQHD